MSGLNMKCYMVHRDPHLTIKMVSQPPGSVLQRSEDLPSCRRCLRIPSQFSELPVYLCGGTLLALARSDVNYTTGVYCLFLDTSPVLGSGGDKLTL